MDIRLIEDSTVSFILKFVGDVRITGYLQKVRDIFRVDHPLGTGNRYLCNSIAESSGMKIVYDELVAPDNTGEAEIGFVDWTGAIDRDLPSSYYHRRSGNISVYCGGTCLVICASITEPNVPSRSCDNPGTISSEVLNPARV